MYKPRGSVLALVTFVLGSVFAAAQNPACAPNTATYPCVYVANGSSTGSGTVSVINATTQKVIGAVTIGNSPYGFTGLAVTPDNASVYVAVQFLSTVAVIDTATGVMSATVTGLTETSPTQIAIMPDGKYVYVVEVNGTVPVIDRIATATNTVIDSVVGTTIPSAIVFAPNSTLAYVADACDSGACVDIVDTTTTPPTVTSSVLITNFTGTGSIAITPDGSLVCLTVQDPNTKVGVACMDTTTNSVSEVDLGIVGLTSYGLAITPSSILYAAEPGGPSAPLNTVESISTNPPTLLSAIQVGLGPTGVAIGPGGNSVYVSNASDSTVSIIDTANNSVITLASDNGFSTPQGVAAMSVPLPVITTQPASQTIFTSQTATLSVVATSQATLLYQWFQGLAGDTSAPIKGGTGSSYTTPALSSTTSYWVLVGNIAGTVNSSTATVTVTTVTPPVITTQPASQAILTGQTATLSVAATSTAPLSYQWYQGQSGDTSVPITGAVGSFFTTPPLSATTSYWVQVANLVGTTNSNTATVTVTTVSPPVIVTQPASQLILTGQTATLSVAATSTVPLSYQWFQGLSGDTSAPIEGAVASSFTTPALTSTTSYWVQVANLVGAVNSNTATVTVTSNQPPTCTLTVEGAGSQTFTNPLSVIATATCADPQGEALTTTVNFGDGASSSGANSGVFTATHTYKAYTQQITYPINVTATDTFGLTSAPTFYSWNLVPTALAPPVFAGQSSDVTVTLALPPPATQPELVAFECTTVTTITSAGSSPTVAQASDLGIDCSSNPPTITLTAASQQVTIVIQTTGASAQMRGMSHGTWSYAFWLPLPLVLFAGAGFNSIRSHHHRFSSFVALSVLIVLAFLSVSCGGGFTAPHVIHATPAGNYQVTVIDLPVGSTSGFVQTSLIVPLTVSPFQ